MKQSMSKLVSSIFLLICLVFGYQNCSEPLKYESLGTNTHSSEDSNQDLVDDQRDETISFNLSIVDEINFNNVIHLESGNYQYLRTSRGKKILLQTENADICLYEGIMISCIYGDLSFGDQFLDEQICNSGKADLVLLNSKTGERRIVNYSNNCPAESLYCEWGPSENMSTTLCQPDTNPPPNEDEDEDEELIAEIQDSATPSNITQMDNGVFQYNRLSNTKAIVFNLNDSNECTYSNIRVGCKLGRFDFSNYFLDTSLCHSGITPITGRNSKTGNSYTVEYFNYCPANSNFCFWGPLAHRDSAWVCSD